MIKIPYFWRKGLWTLLSLSFLLTVIIGGLYIYLESELPSVESLNTVQLQVPLRIYTIDGKLIQEYGEKRRIPIAYNDIPKTLVNALLATEDQRFFEHSGVDVMGLGRATLRMIKTGTKSQGGSTITMQVARNFFLSRKKTFLRKFNEILLAIKIDRELSKEKILELYFNRVYLGNRAYGVAAASFTYYGKPLNQLTLAQQAMLAGLPQAPSTQNPIINPAAALKRRNHVLERLREENLISQQQFEDALSQPLTASYHGPKVEVSAAYVAEMIRQSLFEHFGNKAYTQGYNVFTTLQAPLQNRANEAVNENLINYDKRHGYRGATANVDLADKTPKHLTFLLQKYTYINELVPAIITEVNEYDATAFIKNGTTVSIPWEGISWARLALKKGWRGKLPENAKKVLHIGDVVYLHRDKEHWSLSQLPKVEAALIALNPQNGAVSALVGGFSFAKSKFNRATQSSRQPGSTFKPFVYAAALSKGYTLATLVNDAPIVVDDPSQPNLWRPHNANLTFNGPTRLKEALVRSRNMVSIRVLDDLGFDYTINFVMHFGFQKRQLPRALSLALGSLSVSPMDITAAYAVFANGGYKIQPFLIDHITDNNNTILLQARPAVACSTCNEDESRTMNLAPRVIDEDIAFLMTQAMHEVVERGTARAAKSLGRHDLAGKTGTTNDQVDVWFAGFTTQLVTTVWVGYDTPQPLHEYAASLALPLWVDFMKTALKNVPEQFLAQPANIVAVQIDPVTGLLAKINQPNAITEYFREQDVPTEDEAKSPDDYDETRTQKEPLPQENLF